jgi:hypothetical protein
MKRQICSYDTVAVASSSYTVTDAEGEMYLCNSRCLCIWAVMLVTKHIICRKASETVQIHQFVKAALFANGISHHKC